MSTTPQKTKALTEIQKVLAMAEEKTLEEGEMIFEEGRDDPNFYLILRGSVEIGKKTTEGQSKVIAQLGPGEFLGEGALSGQFKKPASAKAVSPVTVMTLSYERFRKLIDEDSGTAVDFLLSVLEATDGRLAQSNTKLLALFEISGLLGVYRDKPEQLASALVHKLMIITESQDGALFLKNPFSDTFRVIFSTSPNMDEKKLKTVGADETKKMSGSDGHFLSASLKNTGSLLLRRAPDRAPYSTDHLRLLALVAEQTARALREASEAASQKARQLLERKHFEP